MNGLPFQLNTVSDPTRPRYEVWFQATMSFFCKFQADRTSEKGLNCLFWPEIMQFRPEIMQFLGFGHKNGQF